METQAVRVTAADYNGHDFDGRPLEWGDGEMPAWLKAALHDGSIKVEPDDRDYAMWRVLTGDNEHKIAEPGDWIACTKSGLTVLSEKVTWAAPTLEKAVEFGRSHRASFFQSVRAALSTLPRSGMTVEEAARVIDPHGLANELALAKARTILGRS